MGIIEAIWERITDEPAFTLALVQAGLALLVGFGLQLTTEQMALLLAFTAALLGWITRSQVTPMKNLELIDDDAGGA
jgi:hypothetical protein